MGHRCPQTQTPEAGERCRSEKSYPIFYLAKDSGVAIAPTLAFV